MRAFTMLLVAALAGCASDAVRIADGPRNVGTVAPRPRTAGQAPAVIPISTQGPTRPHVVLENMTATARQITVFGKVPTNADVDADLRKRAAELDADAIVNVRYGQQGIGVVSWSQISGEGQAIRYTR